MQRCGSDTSVETCKDGQWGAAVECNNPLDGSASKACVTNASDGTKAACGDWQCLYGVGVCTADGKFLACDAAGTLAREAVACAVGACVLDYPINGTLPSGNQIGRCAPLCTEGTERCTDDSSGQRCKNGRWEDQLLCPDSNATCQEATIGGKTKIGCYPECVPGAVDCDGRLATVTCGVDGTWGDPVACAMGYCSNSNPQAGCVAECVPGEIDCSMDDLISVYWPMVSTATITCSAAGRWGDPVQCATNLTCRYSTGGKPLGCVECAYQNDVGQVDTMCTNNNELRTCTANNTWGAPVACGASKTCVPPEEVTSFPSPTPYCQDLGIFPNTESGWNAFGYTCADFGLGAPMSCPDFSGQPIADCCSGACAADPMPATALCEINL